ncbi:hypothetical protein H6F53_13295 [Trichocoleus sp. FACHB-832]|uniref:hypothetical protein n=1 Tax=Trichocoleus sp. FACHB-832 TaxID=2692875 RepID=UPI001688BB21|nr:hypothetical protein [Trichocoleus sp. FACHB-832]MBD1906453.1 hypothetical protein [Trichocoleus sp. FACHB-832]
MSKDSGIKKFVTNSVIVSLITAALLLIFGFLAWFGYGIWSLSKSTPEAVTKAWEAIAALLALGLASSISSVIILVGFCVISIVVWMLARVFAKYEEFQPIAEIVYQLLTPIIVIPAFLVTFPILVPYAAGRVLTGNGTQLLEQAKNISELLSPPETKFLEGDRSLGSKNLKEDDD